jgi:hypothetical protein
MTIKRGLLPFLTLTITLIFSACFSPWEGEQGAVTVSIGNGEAKWGGYIIKDLLHIITITGPGQKQEARFMGEGTAFFTTAPGTWKIDVKAYSEGQVHFENYPNIYDIEIEGLTLVAVGSASVDVRAGKSNRVSIAMGPAGEPTIEPPVEPTASFTLTVGVITGQNGSWQGIKYGTVTIEEQPDNGLEATEGKLELKTMANIPAGTTVTITAEPEGDYYFVKWVTTDDINGVVFPDSDDNDGELNLTITSNITLYAVFDGDGTTTPENIFSEAGMKGMALTKSYALMTDITLTGDWTPIGDGTVVIQVYTRPFTGTLDGRGHTIHLGNNVKAVGSIADGYYAGLFGYIGVNGTVKNIKLDGSISITQNNGSLFVGAVAGFSQGTIENVASSVTIEGLGEGNVMCGGIVGQLGTDNTGARIIRNCTVSANITGTIINNGGGWVYAGGIAGRVGGPTNITVGSQSSISYCLVGGDITIKGTVVGGILGDFINAAANLNNCVVWDNVTIISTQSITNNVGRIVGDKMSATLTKNYVTSNVELLYNPNTPFNVASSTDDTSKHGADFTNATEKSSWGTSGPGWKFAEPDAPDNLPNETNPWIWDSDKPKLWFE